MKAKVSSLTVLIGILATLPHCGSGDDSGGSAGATSSGGSGATAGKAGSGGASAGMSNASGGTAGATVSGGSGGSAGTEQTAGGTGGGTVGEGGEAGAETVSSLTVTGVVTSVAFTPGSATEPTIATGYYQGALVCYDANNNGKCDASENPATTSATGAFSLSVASTTGLIADIGTSATNTANSKANPSRNVFRASVSQVLEQGRNVVLSPLSTEVVRLTEANNTSYAVEKQNLATRIGVGVAQIGADQVLADINSLPSGAQGVAARESNILTGRFQYAITKLDRGDKYPDALAMPGGDPEIYDLPGVTAATATVADNRAAITFLQAEQAAFNVEAIPRYDHIFIVMLENKNTQAILGSAYAPKINAYLAAGNQAVSYFATGIPSEPNYTALGGADDFGITDDSQWNCAATGANAVTDLPEPDNTVAGLLSSPFKPGPANGTCNAGAADHNIVGKPNLFTAITGAGMTWRTYSESMNPGQDFRTDSVADPAVLAQDHVYAAGTMAANAAAIGDANLILPMPAGLYKTKHHPGMAYQNVRSAPEFKYSNRTLGGGQWDAALAHSAAYTTPAGYDTDQLSTDLDTGNIGNLNFLMPDQCDDMHSITVKGTDVGSATTGTASDCSGVTNNVDVTAGGAIITRGDNYIDSVVKKIEGSNIWKNSQKRVAIVLMFDEGNATDGFNSCCGWNAGKVTTNTPLVPGTNAQDTSNAAYGNGNRGHGMSVFGILSNQPNAPKKVVDSDAYSHFAFVRTLQDMFMLADPGNPASYMNRSKYTEKFIAQNILNLPEFTGSADTHFDAVRPMNHAYVIPAGYVAKATADQSLARPAQTGSDTNQTNIWAVTK